MARRKRRRKKLSKRAAIVLTVVGVLIVGGGAGWPIWCNRDAIWPKDPIAYARKGDKAFENEDYGAAAREYGIAVANSAGNRKAEYLYKQARACLEQVRAGVISGEMGSTRQRNLGNQALRCLETAARENPEYVEPRRLLCRLIWERWQARHYNAGDAERFLVEVGGLLALAPDDHENYYRRARVYEEEARSDPRGGTAKAEADYRKAIQLKKDEPVYWNDMIRFLDTTGTPFEQIAQTCEEAIKHNPKSPLLYVSYGKYLHGRATEDRKQAAELRGRALANMETAIKVAPEDPLGYIALAEFHVKEKQLEKGVAILEKVGGTTENAYMIHGELARIAGMAGHLGKAASAYRLALEDLDQVATSRPADQPPLTTQQLRRIDAVRMEAAEGLARVLVMRIARRQGEGRAQLAEAEECLRLMRRISPADPACRGIAARIAKIEGRLDDAINILAEGYRSGRGKLDRSDLFLLAELYLRSGQQSKALVIVDRMLGQIGQDSNPSLLLLKAECQMRHQHYQDARETLGRIIKFDPANKAVAVQLRRISRREDAAQIQEKWNSGERNEAIRLLEELHEDSPNDLAIIADLVKMYDAANMPKKLSSLLKAVIAAQPENNQLKFLQALYNEPDPTKRFQMRINRARSISDLFLRNVALAKEYATAGDITRCVQHLEEAHKTNLRAVQVTEQLFGLYLRDKKYHERAEQLAKEAGQVDRAVGLICLGRLESVRQRWNQAIDAFKEALKLRRGVKRTHAMLGECYLAKGQAEQAAEAFQAAWDMDNSYLHAARGMAIVAERTGDEAALSVWLARCYRLEDGKRDPWVRDKYMRLQELRAGPEAVDEWIAKRRQIANETPGDLQNRIHLANLLLRARKYASAETEYQFVYDKSERKLNAARLLVGLYIASQRPDQARRLLNDLQSKAADKVGAMLLYADFLLRHGGTSPAEKLMRDAVEVNPRDPRGHASLARYLASQNRWSQAADVMANVVRLKPESSSAERTMIQYLISAGRLEEARKRTAGILSKDKFSADGLLINATIQQISGDVDGALLSLNMAIGQHPNSVDCLVARARLRLRLGEVAEAKRDLVRAKGLARDNTSVEMWLAVVNERMRQYAEARSQYVRILAREPGNQQAISRLLPLYLKAQNWRMLGELIGKAKSLFPKWLVPYSMEADMWRERNRMDRAVAAIKAGYEKSSQSVVALQNYLVMLVEAKRYEEILSVSKAGARADQAVPWLLAVRAVATVKLGNPGEGEKLFLDAVKNASPDVMWFIAHKATEAYGWQKAVPKMCSWAEALPDNWAWRVNVGQVMRGEGQASKGEDQKRLLREAIAQFEKARAQAPTKEARGEIDHYTAVACEAVGDVDKAVQLYERSLDMLPRSSPVVAYSLNNLAYIYADALNDGAKALKYAEVIRRRFPMDANVLDTYGWALAKAGRHSDAVTALRRSILQAEPMPENRYHLGWVFEKMGKRQEAHQQYRQGFMLVEDREGHVLYEELKAARERTKS